MKKIDSLHIDIFKTIYEPLNISKVRVALENYSAENYNAKKNKKTSRKQFNKETSKFKANVLVAEDNIINQKLIKRTLEDLGLNITIANNGLEAFQKRKDENFDLIFMDIQMPFLDGVEATAEILEYEEDFNQPHVPILALTANALKGDRERFLEAGLDEYTTKPLVRSEIVSLLNHFLADFIVDEMDTITPNENKETQNIDELKESKQEMQEVNAKELDEAGLSNEVENLEEMNLDNQEEKLETPVIAEKPSYKADILLAKKSMFESKLYVQLLQTLGYTYELAHTVDELEDMSKSNTYKLVLFDKELDGLKLEKLSKAIKDSNKESELNSYLVLISDPALGEDSDDALYVHELIKNVVNKDLLRLVFEKFI